MNTDRNCLLNIRDPLIDIQACEFNKWPTLTGEKHENTMSQHGLVAHLLDRQHQFTVAGAEGIQPAVEVARMVLLIHL